MIEIFISQPAIDFTPDKLSLIAEALEELGHNLIYDYDEINYSKLDQTLELYKEINNQLSEYDYA